MELTRRASTDQPKDDSTLVDDLLAAAESRWQRLNRPSARNELFGIKAQEQAIEYRNNIESYIGTISIPIGIAGPLRVNGGSASGEYAVPLATSEAALVASYNRGSRLLTSAGGATSRVVAEGVSRTPLFAFENLPDAIRFSEYVQERESKLGQVVSSVTSHGRLRGVSTTLEGNCVYLELTYSTGDAAGQNMVTFASEAVCCDLLAGSPVQPRYWYLEANFSGDKKATTRALGSVRGRRVIAEAQISAELIAEHLHTTPEDMVRYWYAGAIGGVMSGTTGIQGHFANGLAALYLACGQDVACVAESAIGVTRMEVTTCGSLYTSVTLPNIIVGTVGGGTPLPGATACLDILGLAGSGNGSALAEVCAAVVLAGELSIIGAFCSGDFATAHRCLSRGVAGAGGPRDG